MLLALLPHSPAISMQPFTPLGVWQHPKFYSKSRSFLNPAKPPVFPPNDANALQSLPDPGSEHAFKQPQLRPAISIQAGEPWERQQCLGSIFIHYPKACLLSGLGLLQCWSSRLHLKPSGPLRCSKALLVFSVSGSFLSSGSGPAREEQKLLRAQGWGSSQGEMLGLCLVFSAHHTHLLLLLISCAR